MRNALIGLALFAAGGALGAGWSSNRPERAAPAPASTAGAPVDRPAASMTRAPAASSQETAGAARYALQAWEGCRPLDAGAAFTGRVTRTFALSDGRRVAVSLVPTTRDNGAVVFDTLVRGGTGSSRTQVAFNSPLLADGLLLQPVDLAAVAREVSGDAGYMHGPHPMERR